MTDAPAPRVPEYQRGRALSDMPGYEIGLQLRLVARDAPTLGHLSREEMIAQGKAIRARLRFDPFRGRPYLARYELQTFIY